MSITAGHLDQLKPFLSEAIISSVQPISNKGTPLYYALEKYKKFDLPVLIGTSRKSTIGYVLDLPVEDRIEGTAATIAISITKKVDIVRVHDVKEMGRVVKMSDAIVRGWSGV